MGGGEVDIGSEERGRGEFGAYQFKNNLQFLDIHCKEDMYFRFKTRVVFCLIRYLIVFYFFKIFILVY